MKPAYILLGANDISLTETASILFANSGAVARDNFEFIDEADVYVQTIAGNPIDVLEALPDKLSKHNLDLARIISVVDVSILEQRKELRAWFDMLTHFSDVLLLTNTSKVSPAWLNAQKKSLKGRPMEIYNWPEAIKKNADSVIEAIIYPEARRLSQYFEPEAYTADIKTYTSTNSSDEELFSDEEDASVEAEAEEDPFEEEKYFKRDAAGRRVIKIIAP